jgi:hypothetical protein
MTTLTLDIPDSPKELALWLERQLLGPNLAGIVDELRSVHGIPLDEQPLAEALGEDLPRALRGGLAELSAGQLGALLTEPHLLLELQEQVCIAGERYWSEKVQVDGAIAQAARRGWFRLGGTLAMRKSGPGEIDALKSGGASAARRRRTRWFWSGAAAAALLLLAVGAWLVVNRPPPVRAAWGWEKPQVLADDVGRQAYLTRLADAGDEWFAQRPATAGAVAERLLQLRTGCTRLILAPKTSLPPADRDWLNERCKAWAAVFDQHLKDVEAGRDPIEVRNDADVTVKKLVDKLRERAAGA